MSNPYTCIHSNVTEKKCWLESAGWLMRIPACLAAQGVPEQPCDTSWRSQIPRCTSHVDSTFSPARKCCLLQIFFKFSIRVRETRSLNFKLNIFLQRPQLNFFRMELPCAASIAKRRFYQSAINLLIKQYFIAATLVNFRWCFGLFPTRLPSLWVNKKIVRRLKESQPFWTVEKIVFFCFTFFLKFEVLRRL